MSVKYSLLLGLSALVISVDTVAEIPGLAPETNWDLHGYINYRLNGYFVEDEDNYLEQALQQRFNYEYRYSPELWFNAGLRNRLIYSDAVDTPDYAHWVGHDSGSMDLSVNWLEDDKVVANSQFDRMYFSWKQDDWLVRVGRFRINWGMTTIWNPNDIFNTYSVYDTDYIERAGTDGFLIGKKMGVASGFELVFSPVGKEDRRSRCYAGRYFFNYESWDMQLIAGKIEQDNVVGFGFAGAVNDAGVRGETSIFEPIGDERTRQFDRAAISSLEMDYSFNSQRNWIIRGGILHLSSTHTPDSSVTYLTQQVSVRTLSFTEFTGYAEVGFDLTALNRSTLSTMYYQDESIYLCYSNVYSLTDNWQLTTSVQHFNGSHSSLFGITPTTSIYTMIQWNW